MRRRLLLVILAASCGSPVQQLEPALSAPPTASLVTVLPASDCPAGDWCWMKGRPMIVDGDRERKTAYAFGSDGEFLRWATDRWVRTPLPERRYVRSAWVRDSVDAWASDAMGATWHYDGVTWTESSPTMPVSAVFGAPDGSVWAVAGASGSGHGQSSGAHLLRRDQDVWSEPAPPFEFCLGGVYLVLSKDEIWTAGLTCDGENHVNAAEVRRFDGTTWQLVGAPITEQNWFPSLERVGERIQLRGTGLYEWDGETWRSVDSPRYPQDLANDETAHWDGLQFTRIPRALSCNDIYRLDDERVWCFGNGQIHAWRNDEWSPTLSHDYETTMSADAWDTVPPTIWAGGDTRLAIGFGPNDVYRVQRRTGAALEHFDGAAWTKILDERTLHMHGSTPDNVWFATSEGPYQFDGNDLEARPVPEALTTENVTHVHAMDDGTALAVTADVLLRFDGTWTVFSSAVDRWNFSSVAGSSLDSLWLARYRIGRPFAYEVDHFDGQTWAPHPVVVNDGAQVMTVSGRPWLHVDGELQSLETNTPAIELPIELRDAIYWIGPHAVWITTEWQALRRLVP